MKRVTASEARRNWFRLLDEVAAGQVVVLERGGRRIVIRRQPARGSDTAERDYTTVLRVPDADQADAWGWAWHPTRALRATRRRTR
jgi:antitoxin (DNA-binding transcriptional repressor) of toxin-antitoxin stability system